MQPSPELWPLKAAVELIEIGPEGLTVRQLRDACRAAGVRPAARMQRDRGDRGRSVPLYKAVDLLAVCEGLYPAEP